MNKLLCLSLAVGAWTCLWTTDADAQPVLNRVEKLLREQLGTPGAPKPEPGYLGLVADDSPEAAGVRVIDIAPGGPAAQAGVQRGDLIKSVDGQPVRLMDDLAKSLEGKPQGAAVTLTVQRGPNEQRKTVTLGRRKAPRPEPEELPGPKLGGPRLPLADGAPSAGPRLGVRTLPVTAEVARKNKLPDNKGAFVVAIASGSAAELAGVPMGAVIVGVDDQKVDSPQELADAIRGVSAEELDLTYYHHGEQIRQRISFDESTPRPAKAEPEPQPPKPDSELEGGPDLAAANKARIEALEAHIADIEERLKQLEAKQPPVPRP
jgi:S1-C subfamily serine protease